MNIKDLKSIWMKEEKEAHIIEWEFPNFSVDRCFEHLLEMQKMIENKGSVEGTIHRYLIVAKK